ncbi:MAG: hypothetical protein U0Y08_03355 [Bacteroidia bacterium]
MLKIKSLILVSSILFIVSGKGYSQAQAQPQPKGPAVKMCTIPSDSTASTKITIAQATAWADDLPIKVVCADGKIYTLTQFNFTMMTLKPFQSKDFGVANNGIPILARKAIDSMKPGDTIILKGVTGKGPDGAEIKLPNIALAIKE